MNVLIHGLSCTNLSGRQVLCGHLAEMVRTFPDKHRFFLLLHRHNRDVLGLITAEFDGHLPAALHVLDAPDWTSHWMGRLVFDALHLPRLVIRHQVETVLTLSGTYLRRLPCRQFTLALNPWAFIPAAHRSVGERWKARIQRTAYARVVHHATGVGYGSGFMRDVYRREAGREEKRGAIVYPAFSRAEIAAMDEMRADPPPRERMTVVCVSLMTRHKNIEALVRAIKQVRDVHACPARLRLVGGWADDCYRHEIDALIKKLGLSSHVEITGHVSRLELLRSCASARVYCLLSRSESFGIPAVEAQWMGTPVVAARGCAAPEVCAGGGIYVDADDIDGAASALVNLLSDDALWNRYSVAASENARRFQYIYTSRVLFDLMELK